MFDWFETDPERPTELVADLSIENFRLNQYVKYLGDKPRGTRPAPPVDAVGFEPVEAHRFYMYVNIIFQFRDLDVCLPKSLS